MAHGESGPHIRYDSRYLPFCIQGRRADAGQSRVSARAFAGTAIVGSPQVANFTLERQQQNDRQHDIIPYIQISREVFTILFNRCVFNWLGRAHGDRSNRLRTYIRALQAIETLDGATNKHFLGGFELGSEVEGDQGVSI